MVDNDTLIFNRSDSLTYTGAVSGSGQLIKDGAGTLILTGANSYTGATTITAGTLQIGSGGSTGTVGSGAIADNGILAFNRSGSFTVDAPISGSGAVQQNGSGTTILTQDETYTGTTTINAGTLQLGNGGTTGSIQSDITDNGTLAFNRSDTVTYSNVASGTGSLKQVGTGTLILTGANTYSGGTAITQGTLQIGNGGTTGSITGNVADNGALVFDRSDSTEFDGAVSGAGTLTQEGGGTLVLAGANTYTGGTTIASGSIQVGNGGTTGAVGGDVTDNGALVFDRSNVLVFGGAISGTGSVSQIGAGTTALTGNSTYTGGTTIAAGTLELGNGGTTGSIAGNVVDDGMLAFNRSNALAFGNGISGTGGVVQLGGGTTTLSGVDSYTGGTDVNGGTLLVTGSIASSATTVNSGGTLGGTGTVGSLAVTAGGALAPGNNGIGTLNVHGNAAFASNADYVVDSTAAASDLLNVSGSAALNGTLTLNPTGGGYTLGQSITVVNAAGGVSGGFSSIVLSGSFGGNLFPILSYDADHAFVTLGAAAITPNLPSGASTNTQSVAAAIDFAITHDGGALAFSPLASLSGAELEQALGQMAGEEATAFQTSMASSMNGFLGTMLDPSVGGRYGLANGGDYFAVASNAPYEALADNAAGAPLVHAPRKDALTLWGAFHGAHNSTDGDLSLGTHKTSGSDLGGAVGFDYSPPSASGFARHGVRPLQCDLAARQRHGQGPRDRRQFRRLLLAQIRARLFLGRVLLRPLSRHDRPHRRARRHQRLRSPVRRPQHRRPLRIRPGLLDRPRHSHALPDVPGAGSRYAGLFRIDAVGLDGLCAVLHAQAALRLSERARRGLEHDPGAGRRRVDRPACAPRLGARLRHGDQRHRDVLQLLGRELHGARRAAAHDAAHVKLGIEHDFDQLAFTVNAEGILSGTTQNYGGTADLSYRW